MLSRSSQSSEGDPRCVMMVYTKNSVTVPWEHRKGGPSHLESGSGSFLGQGEMMAELSFFLSLSSSSFLELTHAGCVLLVEGKKGSRQQKNCTELRRHVRELDISGEL